MPNTNPYMQALYTCGANDGNVTLTGQGSATVNGTDQTNVQFKGILVGINITVLTAGTLTVTIQGKDASGTYFTVLASAAIAATGFSTLTVYPGIAASANVSASTFLPATFRISTTTVTGPCTATISLTLIP